MKRKFAALGLLLILGLAGCNSAVPTAAESPSQTASTSPIPSADPNIAACDRLESTTSDLADAIIASFQGTATAQQDASLTEIPGQVDSIALSASGDVKERIGAVAEILLGEAPIVMSLDPDEYFAALEAAGRACVAAGGTFAVAKWS